MIGNHDSSFYSARYKKPIGTRLISAPLTLSKPLPLYTKLDRCLRYKLDQCLRHKAGPVVFQNTSTCKPRDYPGPDTISRSKKVAEIGTYHNTKTLPLAMIKLLQNLIKFAKT